MFGGKSPNRHILWYRGNSGSTISEVVFKRMPSKNIGIVAAKPIMPKLITTYVELLVAKGRKE